MVETDVCEMLGDVYYAILDEWETLERLCSDEQDEDQLWRNRAYAHQHMVLAEKGALLRDPRDLAGAGSELRSLLETFYEALSRPHRESSALDHLSRAVDLGGFIVGHPVLRQRLVW